MKVCPKCGGITEEKNAIKCAVCGNLVANENEYTLEELQDEHVMQYIKLEHQKQKRKKKIKILVFIISIITIFLISLLIYNLVKPKGHIIIRQKYYEGYVGETIIIEPEYYGNISAEDLKIDIKLSEVDEVYHTVLFRYTIVDNKFYLDLVASGEAEVIFIPRDDGEQEYYNNSIMLKVKTKGGLDYE